MCQHVLAHSRTFWIARSMDWKNPNRQTKRAFSNHHIEDVWPAFTSIQGAHRKGTIVGHCLIVPLVFLDCVFESGSWDFFGVCYGMRFTHMLWVDKGTPHTFNGIFPLFAWLGSCMVKTGWN